MSHKHYNTEELTQEEHIEILLKARELSHTQWCDMLDCSKSRRRVESDKTFEEIIELIKIVDYCFSFIFRDVEGFNETNYLEIGINTFGQPSYFIWLQLDPMKIHEFLSEYKIKE